tara:strand:- start:216 stop:947 length:732 start_codon:yes stop_codon:yes gene_type:complete
MTFYKKDRRTKGNFNSRAASIDYGNPTESSYAARTNGVIYIQDKLSKRYVAFKSYLTSFSLNITPSIELEDSLFTLDPFISSGQALFTYSLSIDVPAADEAEARANLGKMQELFRYVGTLGITQPPEVNSALPQDFDGPILYNVYFSNLINKGDGQQRGSEGIANPFSEDDPAASIEENGITGIIKKIEYKPSVDTGFFESIEEDDGPIVFLPKHYELNLELLMLNSHDSLGKTWPFSMRIFD